MYHYNQQILIIHRSYVGVLKFEIFVNQKYKQSEIKQSFIC